jgi:hypothetical protein
MNPPPLPVGATAKPKGKPFAMAAIIIAAVGILPLLIYLFNCLELVGSSHSYFSSSNPLLVILMGFVGFFIHAIGLACGIIGSSMGTKNLGLVGMIANGFYLGAILLFGFIGIAGA